MKFQRVTLDNGLEIIAEHNDAALSTSLGFFVRTGSRDENDDIAGMSHFLEHMAFKGTARRSAADVNRELDELGGVFNACTGEEATVFYAKVLPELQEHCVDLLSDIMRPSLFTEEFEVEKKVVLEEIRMYDDQPPYGLDERFREVFWKGHPLSRSVLGTLDTVGALTPEIMRDYLERRYLPNNIVFVATGLCDFDKLTKWVSNACGKWKSGVCGREERPMKGLRDKFVLQRQQTAMEYVMQLVDAPCSRDEDRFTATALAIILGDEVGSRLFWKLVDSGRADSATIYHNAYSDLGCFMTLLTCPPESVQDNLKVINEVLSEAERDGVTEDELTRARNKLLTSVALSSERTGSRLFSIGSEWLTTASYRSVEDDLSILRGMSVDDVNLLMKKYSFSNPATLAVGELDSID